MIAGIFLEGFFLLAVYNTVSGVVEFSVLEDVFKLLFLLLGGGIICIGSGLALIRERREEVSETEEKIRGSIIKAGDKIRESASDKFRILGGLTGLIFLFVLFVFGLTMLIGGSVSLFIYTLYSHSFFSLFTGSILVPSGVLALNSVWCFDKGKYKRGLICALFAFLLFFASWYFGVNFEL